MTVSGFTKRSTAGLLGVVLLVASCSSDEGAGGEEQEADAADAADRSAAPAAEATSYPADEWATAEPAELGFDPAKLEEIAGVAEAEKSFCLLVVRHGKVAGEWYWGGETPTTTHEVFSATKSFASTLVGLAQAEGKLDIDDKASDSIPEWKGTPSEDVTVKDLLSNDSGRHWDFDTDYRGLIGAPDRTAFGIGLGQDGPPGTIWAYNNSAIQTLDAIVEKAVGESPADYAEAKIFEPIGMGHTEMTRDPAGNTNMFFGIQSTCQDMARFGHLFLNDGDWDGTEVVPAEWVEEATGAPSQDLNASYGYLWWLNRKGPQPNPGAATDPNAPDRGRPREGQSVPGAPEDMYWAHGLGDQIIAVDPGSDTVVVRLGPPAAAASTFGRDDMARVVTEALVDPDA